MVSAINSFENKLDLWIPQLSSLKYQHLPSINKLKSANYERHINGIQLLKDEFNRRFQDLVGIEPLLPFLANSFLKSDVSSLALLMEKFTFVDKNDTKMEIINIQNDSQLKYV